MDITALAEYCEWGVSKYFIFSDNVFASLIYYSHLLPIVTSFIIGVFLLYKNRSLLSSRILAITLIIFSAWVFSDLILWASEKDYLIMFFWSMLILFEPIIYAGLLYFIQVYIDGKDISPNKKLAISVLLLPTIILTPTKFAILNFNLTNCDREVTEGLLVYYGYLIEVIYAIWAALYMLKAALKSAGDRRKQVILTGLGTILFMLAFAWGNISGSISEDWAIGQYGLLGMPVFVGFLVYLIVRYKTFNIKLFGAKALVVSLAVLTASTLFLRTIESVREITLITLFIVAILGFSLVRSVRKEIEQREHIEKLALDLERANAKLRELDQLKSEFLSFATHQIRAPLTAIDGYASMLLEGDFGKLPDSAKKSVSIIDESSRSLIGMVNEFLDISRIEQGRMKYEKLDIDLAKLVQATVDELRPNAEGKGLKYTYENKLKAKALIEADQTKLKQVIANIIDNSIKYTISGQILILLTEDSGVAKISIRDTGVGIDKTEISNLFSKFGRAKDANKVNVTGTGLGLYIAREIARAHGGDVKVDSDGKGKGSTFEISIPLKK